MIEDSEKLLRLKAGYNQHTSLTLNGKTKTRSQRRNYRGKEIES